MRPSVRTAAVLALAFGFASQADAAAFSRADRNQDRVVALEELRTIYRSLPEVHFYKFDTDRDGVLSRAEYAAFDTWYSGFARH